MPLIKSNPSCPKNAKYKYIRSWLYEYDAWKKGKPYSMLEHANQLLVKMHINDPNLFSNTTRHLK